MTVLARVYRGQQVESFHSGSIAVVDSHGHLLAFAGDPNFRTSLRSAAKPFQGIPLLEYGGGDEYELSPEEVALTCASHGGEPLHVSTAAALLRKGEFDESDLLCGAHMPYDEKSAAELRAAGEEPSPLHNNCSGKHAGMLLATRVMDVPSSRYIDADHPIQVLMRSTLAEFAGVTSDEIPIAIDGCGVPAFYLSLRRAALHALQLVFELVITLRSVLGAPAFHAAAVYPIRRAENLRSPWCPCLRRATSAPSWGGRVEMSSLANTCARWAWTVRHGIKRRSPICGLDSPSATGPATVLMALAADLNEGRAR